MKSRNKLSSIMLWFMAFCGAVLGVIHLINRIIFMISDSKNSLNGVWKSRYGDVAFTKTGQGSPLLLVHGIGIGAGSDEWEKNILEFSKTRTVYALDLPGFANSEKSSITYNSYYYAKVINGFISSVIRNKTDVSALGASGGIVLAGAALSPELYNSIVIVNPYDRGMGAQYKNTRIIRETLRIPVIGTFIYNFISSKQSVLSYLGRYAPESDNYTDIKSTMEKRYKNAHRFGANSKYAAISFLNGYTETPVFKLMEKCATPLCIVVSAGSPVPMLAERTGLALVEINSVAHCPNIYANEEFTKLVMGFLEENAAV